MVRLLKKTTIVLSIISNDPEKKKKPAKYHSEICCSKSVNLQQKVRPKAARLYKFHNLALKIVLCQMLNSVLGVYEVLFQVPETIVMIINSK